MTKRESERSMQYYLGALVVRFEQRVGAAVSHLNALFQINLARKEILFGK